MNVKNETYTELETAITKFGMSDFSSVIHEDEKKVQNKLAKHRLSPAQVKAWFAVLALLKKKKAVATVIVKHDRKDSNNNFERIYGTITSIVGRRIVMTTVLGKERKFNLSKVNQLFT